MCNNGGIEGEKQYNKTHKSIEFCYLQIIDKYNQESFQ